MNTCDTERLSDVWREVCQWAPRTRLSLASRILQSLEAEETASLGQHRALSELIGAWKTDQPSGDEEIERLLDEERLRKHGGCTS